MKKDKEVTDVIFRKAKYGWSKGLVFALFPHECETFDGKVNCYEHIGQHSSADYKYCISVSQPVGEDEYSDLKKELESLGYNLRVVKRQNYDKFLESYHSVRGGLQNH
ncbi:MAG: hypothetical protein KGY51_11990 [Psychroflexus sp.]|nr:hypothetical protein [Psychroflexus sp.]